MLYTWQRNGITRPSLLYEVYKNGGHKSVYAKALDMTELPRSSTNIGDITTWILWASTVLYCPEYVTVVSSEHFYNRRKPSITTHTLWARLVEYCLKYVIVVKWYILVKPRDNFA